MICPSYLNHAQKALYVLKSNIPGRWKVLQSNQLQGILKIDASDIDECCEKIQVIFFHKLSEIRLHIEVRYSVNSSLASVHVRDSHSIEALSEFYNGIYEQQQNALFIQAQKQIQLNSRAFIMNFPKFGLVEPSLVLEIVLQCAECNSIWTAITMQNFNIACPDQRYQVAQICARKSAYTMAGAVRNFSIDDEDRRYAIAILCLQHGGWNTADQIHNFAIKDQDKLWELALLGLQLHTSATAKCFENFHIADPERRFEAFKLYCQYNVKEAVNHIANFNIDDHEQLSQLATLCVHNDPSTAIDIVANFPLPALVDIKPLFNKAKDTAKTVNLSFPELFEHLLQFHQTNFSQGSFAKELENIAETVASESILPTVRIKEELLWLAESLLLAKLHLHDDQIEWLSTQQLLFRIESLGRPDLRLPLVRMTINLVTLVGESALTALLSNIKRPWNTQIRLLLLQLEREITEGDARTLLPYDPLLEQAPQADLPCENHNISAVEVELQPYTAVLSPLFSAILSTVEADESVFCHEINAQIFITMLWQLCKHPWLTGLDKQMLLKRVFFEESDSSIILSNQQESLRRIYIVCALIDFKATEELRWDSSRTLADAFKHTFQSMLTMDELPDLTELYFQYFGSCCYPLAAATYASCVNSWDDDDGKYCFGDCISAALKGTLGDLRHDLESNPHLRQIAQTHSELITQWRQCLPEVSLTCATNPSSPVDTTIAFESEEFTDFLLTAFVGLNNYQHIGFNSLSNKRKGLLEVLRDGKARLLAIKDGSGRILASCFISLLWDGDQAVLYRNRFDPPWIPQHYAVALNRLALNKADVLGLPALCSDDSGDGLYYGKNISALVGSSPWIQCHGASLNGDGGYTIRRPRYLQNASESM